MDEVIQPPVTCTFCHQIVDPTDFFCPACGKNIKEKPLSCGLWTQIGLYTVSIIFAPLFIGWTFKYIKSSEEKAQRIGFISLILTIIAIFLIIWSSLAFTKTIMSQVNTQLGQYQNMGL